MALKKQFVALEITYDDEAAESPDNWVWFDLLETLPEWVRVVGWGPVEDVPEDDEMLTISQAAEVLQVSTRTLVRWRDAEKGPPFIRLPSGHARYPRKGLDEWKP